MLARVLKGNFGCSKPRTQGTHFLVIGCAPFRSSHQHIQLPPQGCASEHHRSGQSISGCAAACQRHFAHDEFSYPIGKA